MSRPDSTSIPYGYCHCGCGEKTPLYTNDSPRRGTIVGEPRKYLTGHHARKSPVRYIVEDRGYETPCWIWQGATVTDMKAANPRPYGCMRVSNKPFLAHRHYYSAKYGTIPPGMFLDHLCRQTLCVNPDHLEPVSNAENCRRGIQTSVMTEERVMELFALRHSGMSLKRISEVMGLNYGSTRSIACGQRWGDIKLKAEALFTGKE